MGHNAVSLAMKSRRLAYVHKKEHTNPFLQQHFSIAAPFYNEEPKIEGYLAFLSTESVDVNMTIGMFNASIKFIESQYKVNSALEKLEKEAKIEDAIIKSIYDGFLVLSPDGTITHANHKAASWLGKSIEELIGRKLSEFVLSPLHVMEVFKTGRPMIDKELFVKLHNKTLHIYKTAVPVHDEQGRVVAAINLNKEIKEVRNLVNQMVGAKASFFFKDIIYKSKQMAETVKIAEDAARCPLSVLIQGESGTGKELFAHAIHNASVRKNGPFIIIDCASIPHELVESELFGFVEGSFTGARKGGRTGKFELANGGTIFLDEIGEMPLDSQAKFLRVLQGHSITRVGGTESIPINIRVIAATNRDLKEEVKKKNFREDLYYRLNVLTIEIPPLRIRIEDVEELVQFVLRKYEEKLGKKDVSFSKEAMEILKQYHWPGNVRELENTVVRAINLCEKVILPEHVSINNSFASFRPVAVPKCMSYRELEKQNIIDTLKINNGNRAKTAKMLGIARSTLYSKIKYFNM
jgi:PAS domain S-box-containing protein